VGHFSPWRGHEKHNDERNDKSGSHREVICDSVKRTGAFKILLCAVCFVIAPRKEVTHGMRIAEYQMVGIAERWQFY
jgi:hypothetical protein